MVNVDGAYCEQDRKGGWGYVIRNEEGRVIQSGAGCKQFACNAMHMELIACIEGVKAAGLLGVSNIVLETDAMQVIQAFPDDGFRLATVGGLVHELKELLMKNFVSFQAKFGPRECNRVAHELASLGSRSNVLVPSVMAGVPECILNLVSSNLADMVR
jgi:ribonuclease HI